MKTLKNYKKLFADFWGYHENDIPACWYCNKAQAVDIHHIIPKRMGGVKGNRLNRIDNLFPLCRSCHDKAHSDKSLNEQFKRILTARFKSNREEKIEFWIKCKIPVDLVKKQIARLDEKYRKYGIDV